MRKQKYFLFCAVIVFMVFFTSFVSAQIAIQVDTNGAPVLSGGYPRRYDLTVNQSDKRLRVDLSGVIVSASVNTATNLTSVTNIVNPVQVFDHNQSNFLATLTNQLNLASNLLWGLQTQGQNVSNYWAWTTNWFGGQSNFLSSATNQFNNISNFLASATNSLTSQSNFLATLTNQANLSSNLLWGLQTQGQNVSNSWASISNKLEAGLYVTNSSWTSLPHAQMTRTNNTTQYTAGDVMCDENTNVLQFVVARANGGTGWILGADCVGSANQTTKPFHELWLFTTVPTIQGDNIAWEPTYADLTNRVGIISFSVFAAADAGAGSAGNGMIRATLPNPMAFQCAAGTNVLYGVAIDRTAYTPIASESFDWQLTIKQD